MQISSSQLEQIGDFLITHFYVLHVKMEFKMWNTLDIALLKATIQNQNVAWYVISRIKQREQVTRCD